jgi:hypothetical protein
MLRSLGRFTTRYFLIILIIFIYIIIDSFLFFCHIYYTTYFRGLNISSDVLTHMFVNNLLWTLVFVVFSSPPLLSLFLLRHPSFARVLLYVATAFYILWIVYVFIFSVVYLDSLPKYVDLIFLLVYSGAALVAGLPEATAAGKWARGVYYTALLLWLSLVVALLSYLLV